MITPDILRRIMPLAGRRADTYAAHLAAAMAEYEIATPARAAAFIAQVAHESGQLLYVRELASGRAYEWRADLGNTQAGDGPRFRGRGLIQITGRSNYKRAGAALYGDSTRLLERPELLEEPEAACRSAAWFWWSARLNPLADAGRFEAITRRINGGLNGQAERLAFWARAKEVLGCG